MSAHMPRRARNFLVANEDSPVVYGSVDGCGVTYRLANGKMFRLNMEEARRAPNPKWAFVEKSINAPALAKHEDEEARLLERVEAELVRGRIEA